jgi:phosphomethylpyrimidine synthase
MTLMEDAKRGIITPSIEAVAKAEGIDPEIVRSCVVKGQSLSL